jgi:hypothetical protein
MSLNEDVTDRIRQYRSLLSHSPPTETHSLLSHSVPPPHSLLSHSPPEVKDKRQTTVKLTQRVFSYSPKKKSYYIPKTYTLGTVSVRPTN